MARELVQDNKRQMRIALVGVNPADQVTLKGYLRVLLRLDVNLTWTSANEPNIDLFMINNEFRGAASVSKLLDVHRGAPVLYVARNELGEGSINQNLLTLPLKQINLLNDWLVRHVPVLGGNLPTTTDTTPHPNQTPSTAQKPAPITSSSIAEKLAKVNADKLNSILDMIEKVQARKQTYFEITDSGTSLAIIDTKRQLVWAKTPQAKLSEHWQFNAYTGKTPNTTPQDSNAWLWQAAWDSGSLLLDLVDDHSLYQIRYWVKPKKSDRRDLLQIMTAMESKPSNVAQIAQRAKVSVMTAKKAVATFLLSGNLTQDSYHALQTKQQAAQAAIESIQSKIAPAEPTSIKFESPEVPKPEPEPKPEQEEKLSFLARLRRRLGL